MPNIMISHIEANYERGLTADIIDYGSISDLRKKVIITGPTEIVVRRDYLPGGSIQVAVGDRREVVTKAKGVPISRLQPAAPAISQYRVRINGKERTFQNNEHVEVVKGDTFEIVDVTVEPGNASRLQVNFKGYVGNSQKNTGEDRGYVIDTGKDLWRRYSLGKKGRTYYIIVKYDGEPIGKLFVNIKDPASK